MIVYMSQRGPFVAWSSKTLDSMVDWHLDQQLYVKTEYRICMRQQHYVQGYVKNHQEREF